MSIVRSELVIWLAQMELGEWPKWWAMDQSEQVQITMFAQTLFYWEVTGEPDVTHETAEVLYIGQDTGDPRHANLWGPETTVTRVWSRQGLWRTTRSVKLLSTPTALLLCSQNPYLRRFPNIPLQIFIPKGQWHIWCHMLPSLKPWTLIPSPETPPEDGYSCGLTSK